MRTAKLISDIREDYLQILDEIPALLWRSGLDAKCNYFNHAWLAFTGRTMEQELGDGWVEGVHPDDRERCMQVYLEAFERREPFEIEYRLGHVSGEYRWILDIGRPIRDANGGFSGYIGTCYDLTDRKAMEKRLVESNQALRESEAMFKGMFDYAPDAVLAADENGMIRLANQRAYVLFGYTGTELAGLQAEALLPGLCSRTPNWNLSNSSAQGGSREPVLCPDLTGIRKDGSGFPAEVSLGPVQSVRGSLVLITVRDKTEQKMAEDALRAREFLLVTATVAAPIVFFSIDKTGIIRTSIGKSLSRRIEGIDPVGKSIYDLYKAYPKVLRSFERALEGETLTSIVEAGDLVYEATYAPLYGENGEITGVVGTASDVTRHRQVEEALRESEAHFRTIFYDAIQGIKLIDLDGRIVEANPAMEEMIGYTNSELRNMSYIDLTHPEDTPVMKRMLDELTAGNRDHFRIEKRYLRKNGEVMWGRLAMSLFRSQDGTPLYCIGMVENITAQKQAEAELAELQRRLSDSAEAERLQLAQELHDGPLQDLQALSFQISALEALVGEEAREETGTMQEDLHRVSQALRSICGELRPPALAPFGLEKAIRSHAEHFREQHPDMHIHLDLVADGKQLPERVRLALFRIYQHTLANTLRHSEASGVSIHFRFDDEMIVLEVADNGKGFRVPLRWIELVRGGHFGLVGSIERAESVGGRLEIHSAPGKGTRVRVTVPRREEDQVTARERLSARI